MNTLLKTILLGVTMVSTTAMAELSDFTGFEAGASLNMVGASTLGSSATGSVELGGQTVGVQLHGGYGFEISKDSVLHLGLDFNASDIDTGTTSATGTASNVKIKNAFSLSLAPGMFISDKTLAYFKLSYEAGKLELSSSSETTNLDLTGVGYGFGLRTQINKTTFLETQVKQVKYNAVTNSNVEITPKTTIGSVGVVFKF